ncbi:DUF3071 domain-containing protein [Schaalia sp. ZJ405]|uniref:septation protein SepH n=1 Tax=unclassified Schaalia TaxID=2691889 RepID=UPI0013EA7113|nr:MULTISPECIES: septation protein SepH [unclassified Schaalia]QPK81977.1 DUF3071 domain-containing protein [Schaalia sp. ZJ405]
MIELELLGVGGDGESLVFTDTQGERYQVPITDELRAATRRDRPRIEVAPEPTAQSLRPRDIQSLLRAGASPEELASAHGMDVQSIRRYEAPVEAEKQYALQRARSIVIGSEPDGPLMGDLVVDRLAARGVDPQSLTWTARRGSSGPWQICLTFVQGAAEHAAQWSLHPSGGLDAVDQEAQWLTETVAQAPTSSIFTPLPQSDPQHESDDELRAREAIVDQLNAARGKRQDIEYDIDEDEDASFLDEEPSDAPATHEPQRGSISARIYSLAQARTRVDSDSVTESNSADAPSGADASSSSPKTAERASTGRTIPAVDARPQERESVPDKERASSPAVKPEKNQAAEKPAVTSVSDATLPGLEDLHAEQPATKKTHTRRRSVPSWDEIVFGSKN